MTVTKSAVVTNPQMIADIRRRVAYARLPWWRRLTTPPPVGWCSHQIRIARDDQPIPGEDTHTRLMRRVLAPAPDPRT